MTFEPVPVEELIAKGEGPQIEFKRSDILSNPHSVAREITAIANTMGRGYSSYTQVAKALDRFPERKKVLILYLGDHDPSGIHIQAKLESRLKEYARSMGKNVAIEVQRMALTSDQAKSLNLPPSKMKKLGQGSTAYRNQYGSEVWELDALEPAYLLQLVENAILERMDKEKWEANRKRLEGFREEWVQRLREALGGSMPR